MNGFCSLSSSSFVVVAVVVVVGVWCCLRITSGGLYVPCIEYLVVNLTRMAGTSESYRRRLRTSVLCLCRVFRVLIN